MASSLGDTTNSIVRNITQLYRSRKMKLNVESVDAPIANYYVYVLMSEGKTMDSNSWYMRKPNGGVISNGNFELALVILDKKMFKKSVLTRESFKQALDSSGLVGDNCVVDLRYIHMKNLMQTMEMYRKIIYEEVS